MEVRQEAYREAYSLTELEAMEVRQEAYREVGVMLKGIPNPSTGLKAMEFRQEAYLEPSMMVVVISYAASDRK